mgnify:CR=1 FL=1
MLAALSVLLGSAFAALGQPHSPSVCKFPRIKWQHNTLSFRCVVLCSFSCISIGIIWGCCLPILGMLPARVVTQRTRPLKVTSTKPRSASLRKERPTVLRDIPYSDWIVSFDFMKDRPLPVNESISASNAFSTNVRSLSNHISAAIHTPLKFRSILKHEKLRVDRGCLTQTTC